MYNQLDRQQKEDHKPWLKRAIQAAIKEYNMYWMVEPALDTVTGLSRYRPAGQGIPPETEASHFTHILQPYADALGVSVNEYIDGYNERTILEPELDEYFLHDRGVRESGHDTSYRLEKKCADLATVDLNSLLYKVGRLPVARVKLQLMEASTRLTLRVQSKRSLTTSWSSRRRSRCPPGRSPRKHSAAHRGNCPLHVQ